MKYTNLYQFFFSYFQNDGADMVASCVALCSPGSSEMVSNQQSTSPDQLDSWVDVFDPYLFIKQVIHNLSN